MKLSTCLGRMQACSDTACWETITANNRMLRSTNSFSVSMQQPSETSILHYNSPVGVAQCESEQLMDRQTERYAKRQRDRQVCGG